MALVRWNDDRLDDLSRTVRRHTERLDNTADIAVRLQQVEKKASACLQEIEELERWLRGKDEQQHKDRKADRKWMVATVLSTAGLVIAALAVFL